MRLSTIIIGSSSVTLTMMTIMLLLSDQKLLALVGAFGAASTILSQMTIRNLSETL